MRVEAAQRLAARPPATIAQARRTPGVTPTDIGALLVHLRRMQLAETATIQLAR
jgi:tRNA U34 5-carboxymethylaminomethyl modifying enzyme MnmG/GidA